MPEDETPELPIHNLADRHPGLSADVAGGYTEAARVCLDRRFNPPVEFTVADWRPMQANLAWLPTDARIRRAWNNAHDATESGAYACALAALELSRGLVSVGRVQHKRGADFFVVPKESLPLDTADLPDDPESFEDTWRFEVSGTDSVTSEVNRRVKKKLNQLRRGGDRPPGVAGVVGFQTRRIVIRDMDSA